MPSADVSSAGTTKTTVIQVSATHTPADVHYGRAELVRSQRGLVLDAAYAAHPERFVRKPPTPPALPTMAWINRPQDDPAETVFV